jgi:ATP phosphoribosyltransferase
VGHSACICVHKKQLYDTVKVLRVMGGSGVLVSPMTYIFDEEPQRWIDLLQELGLQSDPLKNGAQTNGALEIGAHTH